MAKVKQYEFNIYLPGLTYITYLHNWSLQPFSQDYCLVSPTSYVVCGNFISEWRDLQFKFDSEQQILRELFMAILFALRVFARNPLGGRTAALRLTRLRQPCNNLRSDISTLRTVIIDFLIKFL